MTDAEWQAGVDIRPMLAAANGRVTNRKLRLFACACCRRVWHLITDAHCRTVVEVAESHADDLAPPEELDDALERAFISQPVFGTANRAALYSGAAMHLDVVQQCARDAAEFLAHTLCEAEKANAWAAVRAGAAPLDREAAWARYDAAISGAIAVERSRQADLLREMLSWNASSEGADCPTGVVLLAEALYNGEDCAFALHDALLEAGHSDLAEHFSAPNHPKGCWRLDSILGRC